MYELNKNQLYKVEEVVTENQTAIIKTCVEIVENNTSESPVYYETLPDKLEIEGKIAKLNINPDTQELYYEYIDRPMTTEEYIAYLENELLIAEGVI